MPCGMWSNHRERAVLDACRRWEALTWRLVVHTRPVCRAMQGRTGSPRCHRDTCTCSHGWHGEIDTHGGRLESAIVEDHASVMCILCTCDTCTWTGEAWGQAQREDERARTGTTELQLLLVALQGSAARYTLLVLRVFLKPSLVSHECCERIISTIARLLQQHDKIAALVTSRSFEENGEAKGSRNRTKRDASTHGDLKRVRVVGREETWF